MKRIFAAALGLALALAASSSIQTINYLTTSSGNVIPENAAWSKVNTNFGQLQPNPQALPLCDVAGIDPTGVTDSRAAVQTELTAVAGTSVKLWIDCPIYVHIGYTSYATPIFVGSNTAVEFGPNGYFIVDNIGQPAFVFENVSNVTWRNTNVEYIGQMGTTWIYQTYGPAANAPNAFNNNTLNAYAVAHNGNTFSGAGNPLYGGITNINTIFYLHGGNRLNFVGKGRVWAPEGTSVANYAPCVFSLTAEWNYGVTGITTAGPGTTANSALPDRVTISDMELDGFYMGFVGGGTNSVIRNLVGRRYSDLQDGTSGTVVFSTLTTGASTGTLSSTTYPTGWPLQTGTYALTTSGLGTTISAASTSSGTATLTMAGGLTFAVGSVINVTGVANTGYNGQWTVTASSAGSVSYASGTLGTSSGGTVGQVIFATLTQSSTAATAFSQPVVGTPSLTTASGNVGGVGSWTAPPHLIYMNGAGVYPFTTELNNVVDFGNFNGLPIRRPGSSGTIISLKFEPANGSNINGYVSLRPDGFIDALSFGNSGGAIRNVYVSYNSNTAHSDGGTSYAWRWPSAAAYQQITLDNITIVDQATVPSQFPMVPEAAGTTHTDLNVTGLKFYMNDWPVGAYGFGFAGSRINLQADVHLVADNDTTTYRGVLANQGTTTATSSNFDVHVFGWRSFTVTFSGTPTTSTSLSSTYYASGWPFSTGTYQVQFSDGEIRYVTFTNGSYTTSWSTALTGTPTTTAYANGVGNNYVAWRNRIILGAAGFGSGNHAHIIDATNGIEQTWDNGTVTESWTQFWGGTPSAGASYTIPMMSFGGSGNTNFAIDRIGYAVDTTLTGTMTSTELGCSAAAGQFLTGGNISSGSNVALPIFAPISVGSCAGQPVVLTGVGGSFAGAGAAQISIRGTQMYGGN